MTGNHHSTDDELIGLLHGDLDPEKHEPLLLHLEACEVCGAKAEAIWREVSPLAGPSKESEPTQTTATAIQAGLFGRLHRLQLAEELTTLGSRGFASVFLGLIGPLVTFFVPARELRRF